MSGRLQRGTLDARLEGTLGARLLEPLLRKSPIVVAGKVAAKLRAQGPVAAPRFLGSITVQEPLAVRGRKLPLEARVRSGTVLLEGDRVRSDGLDLEAPGVRLRLAGSIPFGTADDKNRPLDVRLAGEVQASALVRALPCRGAVRSGPDAGGPAAGRDHRRAALRGAGAGGPDGPEAALPGHPRAGAERAPAGQRPAHPARPAGGRPVPGRAGGAGSRRPAGRGGGVASGAAHLRTGAAARARRAAATGVALPVAGRRSLRRATGRRRRIVARWCSAARRICWRASCARPASRAQVGPAGSPASCPRRSARPCCRWPWTCA